MVGIRIVLVRPTHAGNIGAAARGMKNMGLTELVLVAPHAPIDEEARARAAHAIDVLADARSLDHLDAAIGDCSLVFGTSARARRIDWPTISPRECAARAAMASAKGAVAILFGQERTGLTNDELDRCHHLVKIPTGLAYSSLNVAGAVQIIAYEIQLALQEGDQASGGIGAEMPVGQEQMERFYEHLEQVLVAVGFLDPANPRLLMRRIRRLFNRAQPDQNEMNILRGVLTETMKKISQLDKPDQRGA